MSKVIPVAHNSNPGMSDSKASKPWFQSRACFFQEEHLSVVCQGVMGRDGYQYEMKDKFDVRYIELVGLEGTSRGGCLLFSVERCVPF